MEMPFEAKQRYANFLEHLADTLDLTEGQHKTAKEKYTAVGNFLSEPDTLLSPFDPKVLVQGSIRIGTTVRPIGEDAEFDVDMTCILTSKMPEKQSSLRDIIERRLRESSDYSRMLSEDKHRRCLRLHYADSLKFHLDVVPAMPEDLTKMRLQGVPDNYARNAILISDIEHEYFNEEKYSVDWPKSNTEGYALWFLDRMKTQADLVRMELKKHLMLDSVEDVPEYKVRTPLQRGIQLMKRHRDMMFDDDCNDAPVSIIITTLAAKAYEQVIDTSRSLIFFDILMEMVDAMPTFIQRVGSGYLIANPVDSRENFGDKWNLNPKKARNFFAWMTKFKSDFQQSYRKGDIQSAVSALRGSFGDRVINETLTKFETSNMLVKTRATLTVPEVAHRQKPLWPVRVDYSVVVDGQYKSDGTNWNWKNIAGKLLEKSVSLMFTARTDVPEPFTVYWQIVNNGQEAKDNCCLRGSIFPSSTAGIGGLKQLEETKYSGLHWVECFIVQNGICVARSGEYIVEIS